MAKFKFVSFTLFDNIPESFVKNVKIINNSLLGKQCFHLENAIKLCNDTSFIEDYDLKLDESLETRKAMFHEWETMYNLNAYV
jgi:hypothetical protein